MTHLNLNLPNMPASSNLRPKVKPFPPPNGHGFPPQTDSVAHRDFLPTRAKTHSFFMIFPDVPPKNAPLNSLKTLQKMEPRIPMASPPRVGGVTGSAAETPPGASAAAPQRPRRPTRCPPRGGALGGPSHCSWDPPALEKTQGKPEFLWGNFHGKICEHLWENHENTMV